MCGTRGPRLSRARAEGRPRGGGPFDRHTAPVHFDLQLLESDDRLNAGLWPSRVPKRHADPRQQLVHTERLGQVVIGAEAVQSGLTQLPDLVLLAINLPDQTGWDVLRELKRRGKSVPTIVLSAKRVGQNRLDEFRPLAYLPKPFPIEALLRLVLRDRAPEDEVDGE